MDKQFGVTSVSPDETSEPRANGIDSRSAVPGANDLQPEIPTTLSDLNGIDMPGVETVRPEVSSVRSGRADAISEIPQFWGNLADGVRTGAENKRDQLMCQLLFAAKDLAESQIEPASECVSGIEPAFCVECTADQPDGGIAHARGCRVGRVLAILRDLTATLPEFDPTGKEAVTDGETGRAGDGIRPRVIPLTDAAKALRNAALEEMTQLGSRPIWHCNVCGASVMGTDKTERDIVHGCDCWVGNALVVLSSDDLEGGAR